MVYVNAVGGNDELIFDGRSLAFDKNGNIRASLAAFAEEFRVVEVNDESASAVPVPEQDECRDLFDALVLGLRDYAHKSGFKRALIALSGGIDSALVAVIAVHALGAENVIGVSLPSAISSQHSRDDARKLAENLGIRFETIAIADAVAATEKSLEPIFAGHTKDVTEENIQARIRGVIMMALSNKFGALLLTTGNKSEIAVGYCTLYGDMAGGLAVISDVFKTQVYALSRWINREREIIPHNTIEKPPSAELRPGQVDQDSLPPYDVLDALLRGYVEEGLLAPRSRCARFLRSGGQRRRAQGRPQRIQTKTSRARFENHAPRLRRRPSHPDRPTLRELTRATWRTGSSPSASRVEPRSAPSRDKERPTSRPGAAGVEPRCAPGRNCSRKHRNTEENEEAQRRFLRALCGRKFRLPASVFPRLILFARRIGFCVTARSAAQMGPLISPSCPSKSSALFFFSVRFCCAGAWCAIRCAVSPDRNTVASFASKTARDFCWPFTRKAPAH
ncbi:MAG: NAD(+) synthase [Opitutus sp.]|nr:NAD(+) synthase [Opitutus sp.]